jgi:hypothetical protein
MEDNDHLAKAPINFKDSHSEPCPGEEGEIPVMVAFTLEKKNELRECLGKLSEAEENALAGMVGREIYRLLGYWEDTGCSITNQQIIKDMLLAIADGVPVIYDFEAEDVYKGTPLDYSKLTNAQRIAVLAYAIRRNYRDYPNDYIDLTELFVKSTIPPVSYMDLVSAVPIEGKLITMRM